MAGDDISSNPALRAYVSRAPPIPPLGPLEHTSKSCQSGMIDLDAISPAPKYTLGMPDKRMGASLI